LPKSHFRTPHPIKHCLFHGMNFELQKTNRQRGSEVDEEL
jgi:hypothetical protein